MLDLKYVPVWNLIILGASSIMALLSAYLHLSIRSQLLMFKTEIIEMMGKNFVGTPFCEIVHRQQDANSRRQESLYSDLYKKVEDVDQRIGVMEGELKLLIERRLTPREA